MKPNTATDELYATQRLHAFEDTLEPTWPYLLTWGLAGAFSVLFWVTVTLSLWP